jgi:hypothetical protein
MNAPSHDPLRPHRHDPNYEIPAGDGTFTLELPDARHVTITVKKLRQLPYSELNDCYIVSTGHGTSGPFTFGGVLLVQLIESYVNPPIIWQEVEVISGDGFGNRLYRAEVVHQETLYSPLLAYMKDGTPLTRADGLVRLIVPTERDDALRQVKWVDKVRVL